jgi:DNA-binding winged helix-turn-helix (wHTH) protein
MQYRFDLYTLDVATRELRRAGAAVRIERQVFSLLLYLIEQRARVVPRCELLEQLWDEQRVSEGALTYSVAALRRATGDDGHAQRVVRTVHGVGYRFVAGLVDPTHLRMHEWYGDDALGERESFPG